MQQPHVRGCRGRVLALLLGAAAMASGLSACELRTNTQGNVVDPQLLEQVKPGELNKEQVQTLLGTPSSVSTFDRNTWYYISKQTQRIAFLSPDVLEQQVIEIDFDNKGKVDAIRKFGEEDGKIVEIVSRTTPTRGKSMGMFDQIWMTLIKQIGSGTADASVRDPFNRR